MRTHLQREIENIKKKILYMGAEVEDLVRNAVDALEKRDVALAHATINRDYDLDQLEVEIEEDCLKTLALHQPVASDLRYIVAVFKINNDLERIGDLAVNIAERVPFLTTHPRSEPFLDFQSMAALASGMLSECLDALVNLDADGARRVRLADDHVDDANRKIYALIENYIRSHPERVSEMLHLLSVSRHLERIADQATNIAEDVIYLVEGEIVRHQPEIVLPQMPRSEAI